MARKFEFDRGVQHPDETFGEHDRTTTLPVSVVAHYRDKDRSRLEENPRHGPEYLPALTQDIKEHGIGNPVVIFHDKKRAHLAEGNHRLAAAEELGLEHVPVRVIKVKSLAETHSGFAKASRPIHQEHREHFS